MYYKLQAQAITENDKIKINVGKQMTILTKLRTRYVEGNTQVRCNVTTD